MHPRGVLFSPSKVRKCYRTPGTLSIATRREGPNSTETAYRGVGRVAVRVRRKSPSEWRTGPEHMTCGPVKSQCGHGNRYTIVTLRGSAGGASMCRLGGSGPAHEVA